jgi:hypothetical protein
MPPVNFVLELDGHCHIRIAGLPQPSTPQPVKQVLRNGC